MFHIPSSFVQEHENSFKDLAKRIGDIFNKSSDITAVAYCTCKFFKCGYAVGDHLRAELPDNPCVAELVKSIYVNLDKAWVLEAIEECNDLGVIGIMSYYLSRFRESDISDLRSIVEGKCRALLKNFPYSVGISDIEFFLQGATQLNEKLARKIAHDLKEVIVAVLNTENDYFYIRDFVCYTIGIIDRNLTISILKSLDFKHLESCLEAACTPPDEELVKPIGEFAPVLEKRLLRCIKELRDYYDKELNEWHSEWETSHKPEVFLDLSVKEAARKISSFEVAGQISNAIQGIHRRDKERGQQIVRELDLDRIARTIGIVGFREDFEQMEDCEKILYYIWCADRERAQKLGKQCGVLNLDLLIAKIEFNLKKNQKA